MNTIRDMYDFVLENYGRRGCWISELAQNLGICERNANHLTYAMGYRRGRALVVTGYADFANDAGVQAIFKTIVG